MTEAEQGRQLAAAVRAIFASLARYLALVITSTPYGSADEVLRRPDVGAMVADAESSAAQLARDAVAQAWEDYQGPEASVLSHLTADAARPYDAVHLRGQLRRAHASVPLRHREPGRPGTDPVAQAARERAQAVQDAVHKFAREASFRSRLSVEVAGAAARTEVILERGRELQAEGKTVYKKWLALVGSEDTCHWCRHLHGITIPLDDDFAPFISPATDLSGHGRLTQPPRPYRGQLPGPPLHPHCGHRCRIELVTVGDGGPVPGAQPPPRPDVRHLSLVPRPPAPGSLLTAAAVRAMPEARFRVLMAFLRAAVHELGQVTGRLEHV